MQSQYQPLGGEGGRGGDGQGTGVIVRPQAPNRRLNAGKGLRQPGQQYLRRGRQLDRSVQAVKQLDPEILLEGVDLMADGGRRHMQLGCGPAEAHVAGRCFERSQGTQRREMAVHAG